MTQLSVRLPFEGFYGSSYDSLFQDYLDRETEYLEQELGIDGEKIEKFIELCWSKIDFKAARVKIAEKYVNAVESLLAEDNRRLIKLEFEELTSPKEYNFETDKIFVKIFLDDIRYMYSQVDSRILRERISEQFTSRSGFISFYSNDLDEWDSDLANWDYNQLGTLFYCYLATILDSEDPMEKLSTWELMEVDLCNGLMDCIINEYAGEELLNYHRELLSEGDKVL